MFMDTRESKINSCLVKTSMSTQTFEDDYQTLYEYEFR